MTQPRIWKCIAGIFVATGWHPIWREPIGKQREGERYSCTGFLRVVRAIEKRQWEDRSAINSYVWEPERGLWVLSASTAVFADGVAWEYGPEALPAGIEVLDPGGLAWSSKELCE